MGFDQFLCWSFGGSAYFLDLVWKYKWFLSADQFAPQPHPPFKNKIHFSSRCQSIYAYLNSHLDLIKKAQPVGFLTVDLHVWPDFHGNRSPLADLTLKGMVSDSQSLHKGEGRPKGLQKLGEAKFGERKRGNINRTDQWPLASRQMHPLGKALTASRMTCWRFSLCPRQPLVR